MAYNIQNVSTAGKVTVLASMVGLLSFILIFTINLKNGHFDRVEAQSLATTTVTVLNTPPAWTVDAQEERESSALFPTNAGSQVSWVATGTDSNADPYYLLICKTSASPTPNSGAAFVSVMLVPPLRIIVAPETLGLAFETVSVESVPWAVLVDSNPWLSTT
jgi:hypothetical protein